MKTINAREFRAESHFLEEKLREVSGKRSDQHWLLILKYDLEILKYYPDKEMELVDLGMDLLVHGGRWGRNWLEEIGFIQQTRVWSYKVNS